MPEDYKEKWGYLEFDTIYQVMNWLNGYNPLDFKLVNKDRKVVIIFRYIVRSIETGDEEPIIPFPNHIELSQPLASIPHP